MRHKWCVFPLLLNITATRNVGPMLIKSFPHFLQRWLLCRHHFGLPTRLPSRGLSFRGGLHNMSKASQTCLMNSACVHHNATVIVDWEHGQLSVSIISPASYFYRCTSCFTNRSVYVFTARCFNSLESMYNQVQQKSWLTLIGNQIN